MCVEVELERAETTHDVLRRIGPVDADEKLLGPACDDLALRREHALALSELLELGRVDRDRVVGDQRASTAVARDAVTEVAGRADYVADAAEQVQAPAL